MSYIPKNEEILTIAKVREMNPLVLAYVGDAVHSLYVRSKLASTTTFKTNKLHIMASNEVKAKNQAKLINKLISELTDEEKDIYHRARNSHVNNIAKNASIVEYLESTGFEAIIGYLYLSGQTERLDYILTAFNE